VRFGIAAAQWPPKQSSIHPSTWKVEVEAIKPGKLKVEVDE
jgi:hypothetical protein